MTLLPSLFEHLSFSPPPLASIHIEGHEPILPSCFPLGETGASVLAALGYAASELWHLKTQQWQDIFIHMREAAIAQRSHEYIRRKRLFS